MVIFWRAMPCVASCSIARKGFGDVLGLDGLVNTGYFVLWLFCCLTNWKRFSDQMEGKIHASLCRNRFFILLYHQCFHTGSWKHSRTEYGDNLRPEIRKTAFFRDICGLLCCSGTLRDICLRSEQFSAGYSENFKICRSRLYCVAGRSYCCQQTGYQQWQRISLFYERFYASVCKY